MEGALTARQVVNEGDSSLATDLQEEAEENPSQVVDENNTVSAKKQGPSAHNWSGDWSFWISSSTYKDRNEEYKQQFTHLPESEKLIAGTQSTSDTDRCGRRPYGEKPWACMLDRVGFVRKTVSCFTGGRTSAKCN